jgi:hypothetical protein
MLKKMVDVDELIIALRKAGMDAGICLEGSSSYPLIRLAGGMEIYAFIPDPNFQGPSEDQLIAQALLDSLAAPPVAE